MIVRQDCIFFCLTSGLKEVKEGFRLNAFLWMIGNAVVIWTFKH